MELYEPLKLEIICFENEDVIIASTIASTEIETPEV